MSICRQGASAPKPSDPSESVPHKAPSREPPIPVKEPVQPDRRQAVPRSFGVFRKLPALAAVFLGAGLLLAGCNRADDNRTVGQQVDAAIDKTQQAAAGVKEQAAAAVSSASDRVQQQMPAIRADAEQAGTAMKAAADDAAITVQVSAELAKDADLSILKIGVDTQNGQVTLTGPAPSQAAKDHAAEIAKSVSGVQSVRNQLIVKAG
ncbi:BON domain-containing protein [Xylophilus sp. ASV27]|uniref:BON domain-containing protein n=1 Tax=Xylophilus sp. ASV27 TaxID=2795129 RepID=UPI0018ED722C|nr:BON domain-containing protein [Xylophilus sp. ASV27]